MRSSVEKDISHQDRFHVELNFHLKQICSFVIIMKLMHLVLTLVLFDAQCLQSADKTNVLSYGYLTASCFFFHLKQIFKLNLLNHCQKSCIQQRSNVSKRINLFIILAEVLYCFVLILLKKLLTLKVLNTFFKSDKIFLKTPI